MTRPAIRSISTAIARSYVPDHVDDLPPLSDTQREFTRAYVQFGGDLDRACGSLGLRAKNPAATGRMWLSYPQVLFAIREEQKRAAILGGSVAIATLIEVARNKEMSGTARVAAAKTLAQLAMLTTGDTPGDAPRNEHVTRALASDRGEGSPLNYGHMLKHIRRVIIEEELNTGAAKLPVDL